MANELYIPRLNPLNWYEITPAQFDEYRTKFMDDYRFAEQIKSWQEPVTYAQKWQTSDTIYQQFESNFDPLQIDIIDQDGNEVLSFSAQLQIPNKYITGLFVYQFAMSLAPLAEGIYFPRLSNGNLAELHMICEPICVKEVHEDTVLIQYRNTRYHGDVVFETGIEFGFRVEGSFGFLDPGGVFQTYEDQKSNPQVLSARPFRVWPLVIGGTYGVPDWVVDKFFLMWCCNSVKVDGKSFARNGDGKLEFKTEENYPMRGVTLELKEGINRGSKIVNPNVNTNLKLLVVYNINTRLFGDTSQNAATNLVPIIDTE
jgi:hypothetical protein